MAVVAVADFSTGNHAQRAQRATREARAHDARENITATATTTATIDPNPPIGLDYGFAMCYPIGLWQQKKDRPMRKKSRIKLRVNDAFLQQFASREGAERIMRNAGFVRAKGSSSCWVSKQRRARL